MVAAIVSAVLATTIFWLIASAILHVMSCKDFTEFCIDKCAEGILVGYRLGYKCGEAKQDYLKEGNYDKVMQELSKIYQDESE